MKKCKSVISKCGAMKINQNLNYLNIMNFLKNKTILITGGTGFLGMLQLSI